VDLSEPIGVINTLWCLWWISWLAAAFWTRATVNRPAAAHDELIHLLPLAAGVVLLFRFHTGFHGMYLGFLSARGGALGWSMAALVLCGFAFCWWARLTLGSLWSGTVTRKADHRIVDTGPYRLVCHPIYTGILFAAFVTAAAYGSWASLAGAVFMAVSLCHKAIVEEKFLGAELGPDYVAYAARTPMLVPFVGGRKK
jgi:protein-S-isoprenylcysteine O-methyltransferase Ste14